MKCTKCGKELRINPEQIGLDGKQMPIYHRIGYCDNCMLKWDLDATSNNNSQTRKKESVCGIIGMIISFISCNLLFAIVAFILCLVGLLSKEKKSVCGTIGLIVSILMIIVNIMAPKYLEYVDEAKKDNVSEVTQTIEDSQGESAETIGTISREEFIEQCEEIDYKELARNSEMYKGKKIKLSLKVQQILQGGLFDDSEYYRVTANDEYGMWLGDEYFMYDSRVDDDTKILQDDILTVYAEFVGVEEVTRALTGNVEEVPAIEAIYIDLVDENTQLENDDVIINDGTIDIEFEKYSIKYNNYELTKDYQDEDCIIIYYDFTNNDSESLSASSCVNLKAFQDGVQCEDVYVINENEEVNNGYKEVMTGTTITVGEVFKLSNSNSVRLEVSDYFSINDRKDVMEISLQE